MVRVILALERQLLNVWRKELFITVVKEREASERLTE